MTRSWNIVMTRILEKVLKSVRDGQLLYVEMSAKASSNRPHLIRDLKERKEQAQKTQGRGQGHSSVKTEGSTLSMPEASKTGIEGLRG